ncbi:phosphoglycerate mutase-like protein [Gonapodya prolifera JEL478]|uniref:Phosphoglycerate mutase-like protein n=1 Tax=Gonapodya prolifera (strain JEL478) TaxID=1344416 RepID=A0A139AF66_GONPJ|nr:phosphoglycerate mutase-like protein [Gonapodya prolifera JEL478]|eukprot:KXS15461.1 phosphoglycerate mutase-like protein [Gonapodya prolifera JEL478]
MITLGAPSDPSTVPEDPSTQDDSPEPLPALPRHFVRRPTLHFRAVSSQTGLSGLAQLSRSDTELHSDGRRVIYFSRHGESMANVTGKIGGDTHLSPQGKLYAKKLPDLLHHIMTSKRDSQSLHVWTSTLKRTQETTEFFGARVVARKAWKELDEIDAGICDMMTYEEVEQKFPEDAHLRDQDKFNFRYRSGESYADVTARVKIVLNAAEEWFAAHPRHGASLVIVSHQAVLRCVFALLMGDVAQEEVPYIKVPLHTVMRVEWIKGPGIVKEEKFHVDIPAVDTAHLRSAATIAPLPITPESHTVSSTPSSITTSPIAPATSTDDQTAPDADAEEVDVEIEVVSADRRASQAGLAARDLGLVVPAAANVSERTRNESIVEVGLGGKGYLSGDSH